MYKKKRDKKKRQALLLNALNDPTRAVRADRHRSRRNNNRGRWYAVGQL